IENSTSLVVIVNRNWQLEYANSQYWQITGFSEDTEHEGYPLLLLDENNSEGVRLEDIYGALTEQARLAPDSDDAIHWQGEYRARLPDGKQFWLMQTIAPI